MECVCLIEPYLLYRQVLPLKGISSSCVLATLKAHYTGFAWVLEIYSAILQELERFVKGTIFKTALEKFGFLVRKILKYPKMDITWCCSKHCICYFCSF